MANLNNVKIFMTNITASEYKPKRLKSEFIWFKKAIDRTQKS